MYTLAFIDIVGGCNAKCPLCVTGRLDFGKRIEFMPVEQFTRTVDRLIELKTISSEATIVALYNWGEPILHPNLNGIIGVLNERNLKILISTNASKATSLTESTANFYDFIFSMPGFSQASYDKVHGLRFDKVIDNIKRTVDNVRANGYRGEFRLSFHVYQFNALTELDRAEQWCAEVGIKFKPYYAYLNDYDLAMSYLNKEMSPKKLDEISKSLFLHYVDDLVKTQPSGYQCLQIKNFISVNHRSELLLCCVLPKHNPNYAIGSIFDLSHEQVVRGKTTNSECTNCIGCGVAFWVHNTLSIERERSLSNNALLQAQQKSAALAGNAGQAA